MGTALRRYGERLAYRKKLGEPGLPTLILCPVCRGDGCRWCLSLGLVDHAMADVFVRWISIRAANRARCGQSQIGNRRSPLSR